MILSLCLPTGLFAQFRDDFSDGDFSANPAWTGTDSLWTVHNGQLVSNCHTTNAQFQLSIPSACVQHTQWEWYCQLQLNTSAQNYVEVQLASDSISAIIVRIGSSSDDLCLYKKQGVVYTKLIDGADGLTNHSTNQLRIKVYCDSNYNWALLRDTTGTGAYYTSEGTASQVFTPYQSSFALSIKQSTASFFGKHAFDDFYAGPPITDTAAPVLDSFLVKDDRTLTLVWSEALDSITAPGVVDYSVVPGPFVPASIQLLGNRVTLSYAQPFPDNAYQLQIPPVADKAGNRSPVLQIPFEMYRGGWHDVLVSEIMADPSPPAGLPEYKYLELANRSAKTIRLNHWTLSDDKHAAVLPDIVLPPDSFLIITGSATAQAALSVYGKTVAVANFPALYVTGSSIQLHNAYGCTIDAVQYDKTWYADAGKAEGGYSLERANLQQPCAGRENWQASAHATGGTPGHSNSQLPAYYDNTPPEIIALQITGTNKLLLQLNKTIDSTTVSTQASFELDNGLAVSSFQICPPLMDRLILTLNRNLDSMTVYTLKAKGITDCNQQAPLQTTWRLGIPHQPKPGELLLNEILFDPVGAGADYVELVNTSSKVFNLKDVRLGNRNTKDSVDHLYPLSVQDFLCFPGEYIAVTTDRDFVLNNYHVLQPGHLLGMVTMPTLPNDKGTAVLLNAAGDILDELAYNDHMHHPLLHNKEGVALERLSLFVPAAQTDNWTSATATAGYGTPTYANSHTVTLATADDWLSITPNVFSPDQDGWEDQLQISLHPPSNGYQASIRIFNQGGQLVRELAGNMSVQTQSTFLWKGDRTKGDMAEPGLYILEAEFFNLSGQSERCRKVFAITDKKR